MDKVNKKEKTRLLVPWFAMISVVVFLLTGCHQGNRKESPQPPSQRGQEQVEAKPDSLKEDSMKAFYERMRRWDALHGGMRQRESDK
ncbi:MAG: hypothetical protein IKG95_00475 [Bacteroidales bacterium]|nr:hypothetical protein [Bacteroidales bacterium]